MVQSLNEPGWPAHQEISGAQAPTITALEPASAEIGSEDFTLVVRGQGFTGDSRIFFSGHDEPSTLTEDGTGVTTGVKPSLWGSPCTVDVYVHNGTANSQPLQFEFTAPAEDGGTRTRAERPSSRAEGHDAGDPDLMLDTMYPTHVQIQPGKTFELTVVGRGFSKDCVILFDDEEVETFFLNHNQLYATLPMAKEPDEVDVEVQRGDETSDVLTFEFTHAPAAQHKPKDRKPKKAAPSHKRTKKAAKR